MLKAKPDIQLGIDVNNRKQRYRRWLNLNPDVCNFNFHKVKLRNEGISKINKIKHCSRLLYSVCYALR